MRFFTSFRMTNMASPLLRHSFQGERMGVRGIVIISSSVMEKARARVIIEGRVQGVFFRHHTQETAYKLGVKGWVRNRRDGSVEALFEGDKKEIDQIIQWCHRGPSEARVMNVRTTWENYTGEFEDFSISY